MTESEARREIAEISSMSLEAVQKFYNVDTKDEAVLGVLEAITPEAEAEDCTEAERSSLCASLGLARYC